MKDALTMAAGVAEASELVAGFDSALLNGFARLGPDEQAALQALSRTLQGTPLGAAAQTASAALCEGELLAHHLGVIAAARASLEGARFDALLKIGAEALSLTVEQPQQDEQDGEIPSELASLMEGARQWLVEIALAGLGQLELATVAPVVASLRALQEKRELSRLAALLTGFAHELLDEVPTSALPEPPARRWGDLWSQAMLATFTLPAEPTSRRISGTLLPLGADVRHHDHLLSVVVHSLLEIDGEPKRLVRTPLSAWKVDAIGGAEVWGLLSTLAPELVKALARPARLELKATPLLSSGELLWDGNCSAGKSFDPWSVDLSGALLTVPMPRDRHPLQLAIPYVSADVDVAAGSVNGVPLDMARVSPHARLKRADVVAAKSMVGLLRFDERWSFQPLTVSKGKKLLGPAVAITEAAKIKKPTVGILRERASKLLRA